MQREKDASARVDTEDFGSTKGPILFTSLSKTPASVNSPRTCTEGATALPHTPTNDKIEQYSVASSDTEEELPADARPVCHISDVYSLTANNDGPLSI
jgi:hypothetical protein